MAAVLPKRVTDDDDQCDTGVTVWFSFQGATTQDIFISLISPSGSVTSIDVPSSKVRMNDND